MTTYRAPLSDFLFLLNDVFRVSQYRHLPRFGEIDDETVSTILNEASRFCEGVALPLHRSGDLEGCRLEDGTVKAPGGFREAYQAYAEGGWVGITAPEAYGGQDLPEFISIALIEMMNAANPALYMYPGLIPPAYCAIAAGASDELKALYLPKLISGAWSATMNLTEPQCGTDLGLIRTKALPQEDGTHALFGKKIWITSGEHDFTENIVHLVLARLEGAPDGVAGISLFLVPKFIPDTDGLPGRRNAVRCEALEKKMGLHGSATCEMSYEGATGWLIGVPHEGLRTMFVMMNEARLACGVQALGMAEAAFQRAQGFARDRRQGRVPGGPSHPAEPADAIIGHPSIRRMLLDQRTFIEAARAFSLWLSLQSDLAKTAHDLAARETASDLLALLTPVAKAYLTEKAFSSVSTALQVHGGAGYTEDMGLSQILRDARITQIYEGTNAIQALDLVTRKVWQKDGRCLQTFFSLLDGCVGEAQSAGVDQCLTVSAQSILADAQAGADVILRLGPGARAELDAVASDFLELMGLAGFALMWLRISIALTGKPADPATEAKLDSARYFAALKPCEASMLSSRIKTIADRCDVLVASVL